MGYRVLLVDDSSTSREIQRKALSPLGVDSFDEAENGVKALAKLKEGNYDYQLVLMDINMPEMNGLELLKEVKATPESKGLPVIMCTSLNQKSKVMEAMKNGASNYVTKPYNIDELRRKAAKFLSK